MRLAGRVAVVTGGASGIGEAASVLLAREGAEVVIADVNRPAGERVVAAIRAEGGVARFVTTDVSSDAAVAALVDGTVGTSGRIDVLFNNAGIGSWTGHDERGWWRIVRINLTGVFSGLRHGVRAMRSTGGGVVVNTASHAGLRGCRAGIYGATKAAVMTLTRHAALYAATYGIRVNSVLPGNIYTPIHDMRRHEAINRYVDGDPTALATDPIEGQPPPEGREATIEQFRRIHPLGKIAAVEDIARAVLYLASDDAAQVTGADLLVNGGILAAQLRDRLSGARARAAATPAERPPDGPILVATANAPLARALDDRFARAGLPVLRLDEPTPDGIRSVRKRLLGVGPLAGIVFALRPDAGGDLATQGVAAWQEGLEANLRAPWDLVQLGLELLPPGGAITLVADSAGLNGAGGSPAHCAAAAALIYLTDDFADRARERGVRVNCLIPELTSDVPPSAPLGGPAGADDVAEMAFAVARGVPGLTGLHLSLETSHPDG